MMSRHITIEQIRECVAEIERVKDDGERAHKLEDALFESVLETIAHGCHEPASLAREALKASEIDFGKWYS